MRVTRKNVLCCVYVCVCVWRESEMMEGRTYLLESIEHARVALVLFHPRKVVHTHEQVVKYGVLVRRQVLLL